MSVSEPVTIALRDAGLDPVYVEDLVRATLEEDLAGGVDVTTEATVPAGQSAVAQVVAREAGVIAGLPVVAAAFEVVAGAETAVEQHVADGSDVQAGTVVMTVRANTRAILLGERTALNLVSRLSGIATTTREWADALEGTKATVRDTRKTMPLMRSLDKYAVRVGGGSNHRMSLSESALIKDNHVVAAGGVAAAFRAVREAFPGVPIEVEVDDVAGAVEAVEAGADFLLFDNFSVVEVAEAVAAVDGRARIEVSGGVPFEQARAYADTGIDHVSVGALTHSVMALDIGLDVSSVG